MNRIPRAVVFTGVLAVGLMMATGCASSQASKKAVDPAVASAKVYPLKTCIVTDEKLDKDAIVFAHNGQQIKICCAGCKEDFDKEPAKYLTKLAGK